MTYPILTWVKDVDESLADITESVSSIMAVSNKLEQDNMEGVDEKEWVCN